MSTNLNQLPTDLPAPVDDQAAAHLAGGLLPDLCLTATDGSMVNLAKITGRQVIYVYPMTGQPGVPLPDGWDAIPGARGCTPQACTFRDHHTELSALNTSVFGLSAQTTEYQKEAHARLHLPFLLLSDDQLTLKHALRLPTFMAAGMELYKRLTLVVEAHRITKVFYPVFPPDQSAAEVLQWLRKDTQPILKAAPSVTSFTLRRAEASDADSLALIAAQTFTETFAADNSPENLSSHLRASYSADLQRAEIQDPDVVTLLAFEAEELVGFAQVRRKAAPDCVTVGHAVELHRFYVVRRAHGQGLATALMNAVRDAARELGGQNMWLGVWERNPRAIAFYLKSGFVKVGRHVFVLGSDRQTDLVFVSPVSAPVASAF